MSSPDHEVEEKDPSVFILERKPDDKHLGGRVTSFDKWVISIIIGIVFIVLVTPLMFRVTDKMSSLVGLHTVKSSGVPTAFGIFLHFVIFVIIIRLLMH